MRSGSRRISELGQFGIGFLTLIAVWSAFLCFPDPARATLNNGENAVDILGQFSTYSTDTTADYTHACNFNGPGPLGLNGPSGMAIDSTNHRLFAVDPCNNRMLVFTLTAGNLISSKTP